jgi:hypothetical protein
MSKRTKLRKRTEPRTIKPALSWAAVLLTSTALAVLCIIMYTRSDTPKATGPRADISLSTGPFYLIVLLIAAALFSVVMLIMEIRQYKRQGKARK